MMSKYAPISDAEIAAAIAGGATFTRDHKAREGRAPDPDLIVPAIPGGFLPAGHPGLGARNILPLGTDDFLDRAARRISG